MLLHDKITRHAVGTSGAQLFHGQLRTTAEIGVWTRARLRLGRCDTHSLEVQGSSMIVDDGDFGGESESFWARSMQEFVVKLGSSDCLLYPASARRWRLQMIAPSLLQGQMKFIRRSL
jgi:hypothetical protein